MSWWVGLSRDDLQAAVDAKHEAWKRRGVGFLDLVGEATRARWL